MPDLWICGWSGGLVHGVQFVDFSHQCSGRYNVRQGEFDENHWANHTMPV
jgi:hypothetical protein